MTAKWLTRGVRDRKKRVDFESELLEQCLAKAGTLQVWSGATGEGEEYATDTNPVHSRQDLVNAYGAVLERSNGIIASEELLPASKDTIKRALIETARIAKGHTAYDHRLIDALQIGYASLANFVPTDEADSVCSFLYATKAAATVSASSRDERRRDDLFQKVLDSSKRAPEIMQRTTEEFTELISEFTNAIA